MHVWINLLFHVIILIFQLYSYSALTILFVHLPYTILHETFAILKTTAVMVAYDVGKLSFLSTAVNIQQVVESLIAFCSLWNVCLRNHCVELASQTVGVNHLSFGITCMNTDSFDEYFCTGGIEVLKFQLAKVAAVNGVTPFASKLLNIEMVGSHANFLIRIERYPNISVLDVFVVTKIAHCLNDLCNASFVISSE